MWDADMSKIELRHEGMRTSGFKNDPNAFASAQS